MLLLVHRKLQGFKKVVKTKEKHLIYQNKRICVGSIKRSLKDASDISWHHSNLRIIFHKSNTLIRIYINTTKK